MSGWNSVIRNALVLPSAVLLGGLFFFTIIGVFGPKLAIAGLLAFIGCAVVIVIRANGEAAQ